MARMMSRLILSLTFLSMGGLLAGCSGSGDGGSPPPPPPGVAMNVTTLTGIPAVPGAVDGAGVGGGSAFDEPTGGAIVGSVLYVTDPVFHVIRAIDLTDNSVTTFAGSVGVSGLATSATVSSALFNLPTGIISHLSTTLYVADSGNKAVRAIDLTTNLVSTLTTSAGFGSLVGLALSPDGQYLYVADESNGAVYRIFLATGAVVETITGPFPDGVTMFTNPRALATGASEIYVVDVGTDPNTSIDLSSAVAKIDVASSLVSVVAGTIGEAGHVDGLGASARFKTVYGLHYSAGNLYVSEAGNKGIRHIDTGTLLVSTVGSTAGAPSATVDGIGHNARFSCPDALTGDGTFLYVLDAGDKTVKKMHLATGRVTTIAGAAKVSGSWNGVGPRAVLKRPEGIVSDGTGTYLYFTDRDLHTVRRVAAATGDVVTMTGRTNDAGAVDGVLSAATFSGPSGIAYDAAATVLYVADSGNSSIRAIDLARGQVNTLTLSGAPSLNGPTGLALAGGSLYFSDTNNHLIRSVPSGPTGGTVSVVASSLTFSSPTGIAIDGTRIYVADTGHHRIVSISSGTAVVLAGSGAFGFADGTGTAAQFDGPTGLALDPTNTYLYVADSGNGAVRRIAVATGAVQTVAGALSCAGSADGMGGAAQFCSPLGVAVHGGKVYVTDAGNNIIRTLQ